MAQDYSSGFLKVIILQDTSDKQQWDMEVLPGEKPRH